MKRTTLIYCIILLVATASLSFFAYRLGEICNIRSLATPLLNKEVYTVKNEYLKIESEKQQLEKQKKDFDKQIFDKSHINKELEQSVKEEEQLNRNAEDTKNKIAELDNQIEEKRNELENINNISKSAFGKRISLSEGTYQCPTNIAEGRYTVSGNKTLLLYSDSNTLKFSEDLSRLDSNSFTFDIQKGERIKFVSSSVN